jgi:hypothetical protein
MEEILRRRTVTGRTMLISAVSSSFDRAAEVKSFADKLAKKQRTGERVADFALTLLTHLR